MTAIAPQTDVYLLKVPLELDELNQLTFASKQAQYNYFYSQPKLEADNFTYQRKDGVIRFPALIDDIITYNYVMYRNEAYSDKWFYAFITGKEYVNDNVTNIAIKTDVWQTWQFELNFKPVLIDREHTNDDTIGANLLPENLELGEYVANGGYTNFGPGLSLEGTDMTCIVIDVTMIENEGEHQTLHYEWPDTDPPTTTPEMVHGGVPSGVYSLVITPDAWNPNNHSRFDPSEVIDLYDSAGLGDAIVNVYPMPRGLIGQLETGLTMYSKEGGTELKRVEDLAMPKATTGMDNFGTFYFDNPNQLNSYIPVNNKLLTYPYCFFNVSNNAGSSVTYHYEDFNSRPTFQIGTVFTPSGAVKAYPVNYKNLVGQNANTFDYGITGAKYPIGAWVSDAYTNWLTQNAVNMRLDRVKAVLGAGASIVAGAAQGATSGGGGGAIAGSVTGAMGGAALIVNNIVEQHKQKTTAGFIPDSVGGNVNSGDITWAKLRGNFTYLPMCIKPEFAKCIDEFFSQMGYKTNRVKLPNITGRRNWNFVKTVGCYIDADIPQGDLQEIKNMFDNGVTFWHNPATFADYTQNNDII